METLTQRTGQTKVRDKSAPLTRRVQLMLTDRAYVRMKALAAAENISPSRLVSNRLEAEQMPEVAA